jgi:hypothetical protein
VLTCLDDPQLPLLQWQECMAVLATRLPKELKAQVRHFMFNCLSPLDMFVEIFSMNDCS